MSLSDEVVAELTKVRQTFHTILDKLHFPSETEINAVRDFVNCIGGKQVGQEGTNSIQAAPVETPGPQPTPPAPVNQGVSPVAPDPLAGFSVEDLEKELAARQGNGAN